MGFACWQLECKLDERHSKLLQLTHEHDKLRKLHDERTTELERALHSTREAHKALEYDLDHVLKTHRQELAGVFGQPAGQKPECSADGTQKGLAQRVAVELSDVLATAKREMELRLQDDYTRDKVHLVACMQSVACSA